MSETNGQESIPKPDHAQEREDIAEVQEELDSRADGDGLAAEAGAGEENGLAEG